MMNIIQREAAYEIHTKAHHHYSYSYYERITVVSL